MGTHEVVLDESAKKRNKKSKMKKTPIVIDTRIPDNVSHEDLLSGNSDAALEASSKKKQKKKSKKKDETPKLDAQVPENISYEEQENSGQDVALEASVEKKSKKKSKKKRKDPEPDAQVTKDIAHDIREDADGTQIDDENEPTMADKLASLGLGEPDDTEIEDRVLTQPPTADSVHVLLKQALHADDRALLLDCLYNQDAKVIANSVSFLNPSDVFKLLDAFISITQSRGAVLVCALPWLRSLLLQHSSRIMSQKSSLVALNSLYRLIESRVATLRPAIQLASSLDILFAGVDDDEVDKYESAPPVIYEDYDESEEEQSEVDAMDTDQETNEPEEFSGLSDINESEDEASD